MNFSERPPEEVLQYAGGVEYPAFTEDLLAAARVQGAPEEVVEQLRTLGPEQFAGPGAVLAALRRLQEAGRAGSAEERTPRDSPIYLVDQGLIKEDCRMPEVVEVPQYEIEEEVQLDPQKTALIVVDMQNDFVKEGGSLLVPDAESTIPAIQSLLEMARESGMKVVFSQDTHTDGDPEWEIWPEHVREGSWGWQIVDELAPREDEAVIGKVRYDAFYGTHLDHFLRLWDVDTLVICGTVANICVHYTAASAALRWYNVVIPKDATSAIDPFDLEASLRQTSFLFAGRITTTESIEVGSG